MKDWTGNNKAPFACKGASNHSEQEREQHDFYATDPRAVEMLLELEEFNGPIWEPACGNGHMSKVLEGHDYLVRSSDIVKRDYFWCYEKDFLNCNDGIDLAFPASKQRRGRVQKQIANTLDTSSNKGVAIYSPTVCIGSTQKNAAVTDGSYAPTLTSSMVTGGGHVPMIDTEPLGTLYVHNSKAFGNGYMNDLSKTIKAGNHDTCVVLKTVNSTTTPRVVGGIGEKTSNNGKQYFYQNRIYDTGVATAVATSLQPNYLDNTFRVRKLTPKECWRLMGFDDKGFEKAERVCSNTQLYKQAGNSIVVNVLERILENLLQDRPWETEEITRSEWLDELLGGDE